MRENLLKFSKGNAKLDKTIYSLSLPSGFSCPFASECLSKANRQTGKLTEGKDTKYQCFSATQENMFPRTRRQRWHNFDLLRKLDTFGMANLIQMSLPLKSKIIRLHVAGDFFSQYYFDAWLNVTQWNTDIIFYTYTKSIRYWVNRLDEMPDNFRITASIGGREDHLIKEHNLKYAVVVYSLEEAERKELEIDHDDSHAYMKSKKPFALLIHGTQPAGTEASKALSRNKKNGIMGYSRKKGRVLEKA
jgi:hypothetical protein